MQNSEIKVSIVCTTFNHEKYIDSCLKEFVSQKTNFKFEVIVHDDCSTDKTVEIIKKYEEKYPDIIKPIYQKENQYSKGVWIYENIILPRAKGDYIAFCEGDDVWIDDLKLQKQIDFLDNNEDYVACVHNTMFHRCDRKLKDFPMFLYKKDRDLSFYDIIKWNAFGYQYSSLIVRREYAINNPPFGFGEYPYAIYLSLVGKIRFLAKNMSEYRFRSGLTATRYNVFSKNKTLDDIRGSIISFEKMKDYVLDEDKKKIFTDKINGCNDSIAFLEKMSDEEYNRYVLKNERINNIKLFIRSHFRFIYRKIMEHRI